MQKKLFLLDGMALVYRAHFALIAKPIFNSKGVNTSALYGFASTLIDIINTQSPTHLAVAFDTSVPTARHIAFPAYKAQREAMPEELSAALPHIRRFLEAFRVPALSVDGYEADDIIGTLVHRAEAEDFDSWMVTPDKDFAQLVTPRTRIYKPGRQGNDVEILGVDEVKAKWNVQDPRQVIDILGLWGDTSDNIPGVPGVGEKTAQKLIAEYSSMENLLTQTSQLKGKLRESLEANREQALLCKKLATIDLDVPLTLSIDQLIRQPFDESQLRDILIEFEFNALGRRLMGENFKAGRGFSAPTASSPTPNPTPEGEFDFGDAAPSSTTAEELPPEPVAPVILKKIGDVPHTYLLLDTPEKQHAFYQELATQKTFCFDCETSSLDPITCQLLGLAFSWKKGHGFYLPFPSDKTATRSLLAHLEPIFSRPEVLKVGHNLKFDLSVLRWQGLEVAPSYFDTMLAHCLLESDQRHGMDYLSPKFIWAIPPSQLPHSSAKTKKIKSAWPMCRWRKSPNMPPRMPTSPGNSSKFS
jgi:DNA polymerase I